MFDENEHTHPQNNDEGPRHIHRGIKRSEPDEVEVDSADFFSCLLYTSDAADE